MPAPAHQEIKPSPQPEWYIDGKGRMQCRATRYVKCAWAVRRNLFEWFYSQAGCQYPHDDGTPYALVRRVKQMPRGRTQGLPTLITHSEVILEVRYDSYGPQWVNGLYMDETLGAQTFRIYPPYNLYWGGGITDGVRVTEAEARFGVPIIGAVHTVEIGRAVTLPSDALVYIGTCNKAIKETYTLGYSFPPQTVLYVPPTVSSHSDYTLGTRYAITYRHLVNPFGWNVFWRTATASWETLYQSNGSTYIQYPPTW